MAKTSKVYMTANISGEGLLALYKALGVQISGKTLIKLHMGEPGNTNYLRPEIVQPLCAALGASLGDSNVYYGGPRTTTEGHIKAGKDHGFTFAPIDILDSEGDVKLPINGGKHLKEALFGAHIMNYDWIVSVAHFKGHGMAGFGGTFKNLAIGAGSIAGKGAIHSNGPGTDKWSCSGQPFFEKIVEYNKALMDVKGGKMIYFNVLNNMSTDCDCDGKAPPPEIADIGILASADPVAIDKASVDLVYKHAKDSALVKRIEEKKGLTQVECAEKMGLGSSQYELVNI